MSRQHIPAGLATLLGSVIFCGMAPEAIEETTATFESGGRPIKVERFEPKAPGKYPAVIVLHGSGGPELGGVAFRAMARELARRGYVAHFVHYFDRTGTIFGDDKTNREHFATWARTVADAVTFATKQENVDPRRVGLLGYSLGAYLSLSEAVFDKRVKAVVEYFGGLPEPLVDRAKEMPPTLILHGEADPIVPVKEAHTLERLIQENGVTYEMHLYPKAGHAFLGADGHDSARRTLDFLAKHLKVEEGARAEAATGAP
jgi:carboxymethylenebutenolidase